VRFELDVLTGFGYISSEQLFLQHHPVIDSLEKGELHNGIDNPGPGSGR